MAIPTAVENYLKSSGCRYDPIPHRAAYTAQEEAAATHVPGHQWAKTVVCFADDEPILAVVAAHRFVDPGRLRALAGATTLRLAHEQEFAKLYPTCEPGAMPPFGPLFGQPVFVDHEIAANDEIAFHAGTHADAVRMRYAEFARLVKPTVGVFSRPVTV